MLSLLVTALTLAAAAQCSIFDTTVNPDPFPTTVFAGCKTTDPAAIDSYNSCTFNAILNNFNCFDIVTGGQTDSSKKLGCCTRALDARIRWVCWQSLI